MSSELSRIGDKLSRPEAYAENAGDLAALLKQRGAVEKELAAAEERWLAAQAALEQ